MPGTPVDAESMRPGDRSAESGRAAARPAWAAVLAISTLALGFGRPAAAGPWAAPGDLGLRSDIHALSDAGVLAAPVTTWPLPWGDIARAVDGVDTRGLDPYALGALQRVAARARLEARGGVAAGVRVSASANPRVIRSFEDTPRDEAEIGASWAWTGDRFALQLSATGVGDPADGDSFRPDGSFLGMALGNWMLSAGYQERWWGPGWEGSLILGTNARPTPQVALQRNSAMPFQSKWLSWIGPWSLTTFMGLMDDERHIKDTLLFGLRASARPSFWRIDGLELGLSRTAQWCGEDRPCSASTFVDVLLGRDNKGVNVSPEDEPGNQLAGLDARWTSPLGELPYALYLQWAGEDSRQGGPQVGGWLRQLGAETWGGLPFEGWTHRSYLELTDTACREGGAGFGPPDYNCAYSHRIYRTGYRYQGRAVGHGMDGDGRSVSLGSVLSDGEGHRWSLLMRHMEINRGGRADPSHTISPTPQKRSEIALSHVRHLPLGQLEAGVSYRQVSDEIDRSAESDELAAFLSWTLVL